MKIKGSKVKGVLPIPKFPIYAASSGNNTRVEVIIKLQVWEKVKPPDLQRDLPFEVIVTNQPGKKVSNTIQEHFVSNVVA